MANYNFNELSSYDFEILTRDLLQAEMGVSIESFKPGRDNGIDLRYAKDTNNSFIVQCKHYLKSTFSNLKTSLRKEAVKLKDLKCNRYIVVTSFPLSNQNKDEILKILSPYCKSTCDILGNEDVNNLITKHPNVEKDHYKLWLTSTNVMEKIIHNKIYNQSLIEVENIRYKSKVYVENKSFYEANSILMKMNYCIITGMPGMGKTTLAEMLTLYYIEKDYELYRIVNTIGEAFEVYNPTKKQIFYYDDFLGQTSLEDKLNKNEDSQILMFMETVRRNKKCKFILTTREYILNQAKIIYEKFSKFNFDINKCSVTLGDYTKYEKAKILFNHLYFSDISKKDKKKIVSKKRYKNIIEHSNYSPRIIKWMTKTHRTNTDEDYYMEFINMLNDPNEIWGHIYKNQLKYYSRNLLLLLTSLSHKVHEEELREGFEVINKSRAEKFGYSISENDFDNALKELEGDFIKSIKCENYTVVLFDNPSIRDFMEGYLCNNLSEFKSVLFNSIYFSQIKNLCKMKIRAGIEILSDYYKQLEEVIRRTFLSKDISLILDYGNKYVVTSHKFLPVRLEYIVDLFSRINIVDYKFIKELFIKFIDNLEFRELDLYFLNMDEFIKLGYGNLVKSTYVKDKVKRIILEHEFGIRIEDYENILDFNELYPDTMSKSEIQVIEDNFKKYYEISVKYIISDVTEPFDVGILISYRDSLEFVGNFFDIDVSKEIVLLDCKIENLLEEENKNQFYNDSQDYLDNKNKVSEFMEDGLIDDMFDLILR